MTTPQLHILSQSWRAWLGSDPHPVGATWLQWLWTFLFCCVCAVGFTLLGFVLDNDRATNWRGLPQWWHGYRISLVVSLCIGYAIRILFNVGHRLLGMQRMRTLSGVQRLLYFNLVPIAGVLIGWPLGAALSGQLDEVWQMMANPQAFVVSVVISVGITSVFYLFFNAQARRLLAEKSAAESRLRLLQGQIEPHFLFNTLANVVSLIDYDAPRAKMMLETFTEYLRASLTGLRQDQVSLVGELQLVEHYLHLMKARMEDRLNFVIDCEPSARDAHMPPLLLQPLVENAIHHGLEPQVDGGTVRITARVEHTELVMEVSDDGRGLHHTAGRPGAGVALANLRERLQAKYGASASLTLQSGNPGTRVTLRLPYLKEATA
jgi:hypothetical protein